MKLNQCVAALFAAIFTCASAQAINVLTVPIGNPGNAADIRWVDSNHPLGVGSVAIPFNMGKTEVTNAQYAAFLNAVAKSDPYGLYSDSMQYSEWGGIVQSGVFGNYTYAVKAPFGTYTYDNKPVVYVSSGDAMRFANWLHNGQPIGAEDATTTENGAYTLNGANTDSALAAVSRNGGARWWLPSESEWYKAAYFNPGTGTYFDYPTRTNLAHPPNNNPPSSDTGNSANFVDAVFYTTGNYNYPLTDAGAYTLSGSAYGTFDQGGSVWEWNDTLFYGSERGYRGSSWHNFVGAMRAVEWYSVYPSYDVYTMGFRVASIPEPNTICLTALAGSMLLLRRRRSWRPAARL
jgi:formylglycine-generating enzyme